MRIIVSNELNSDDYRNYKVVPAIRDLLNTDLTGVDCIILHRLADTDFNAGMGISKLQTSGSAIRFFYICENPVTTITMAIQGIGGVCIEDEFYLSDEEELDILVSDNLNAEETSLSQNNLLIVKDFVQAFMRKEERIMAPLYLEQVKTAVNELSETVTQQEIQKQEMGNSAINIFEQVNQLVSTMASKQKELTKQLNTLVNEQSTVSSGRTAFGGGGVFMFPTFKYTGSAKVLAVREYSPCRYLTSFMLAYHHYLVYIKNKRVKLVFVHQKGSGVAKKYSEFTTITQESMMDDGLYKKSIIATNNPKNEVMRKLTKQGDNVVLFVDRLYSDVPIISSKVVAVNAVSGVSDLSRYNLRPSDTIFSTVSYPNNLFTIFHIKGFPHDSDSRYATYMKQFEDAFKLLDRKLGIE